MCLCLCPAVTFRCRHAVPSDSVSVWSEGRSARGAERTCENRTTKGERTLRRQIEHDKRRPCHVFQSLSLSRDSNSHIQCRGKSGSLVVRSSSSCIRESWYSIRCTDYDFLASVSAATLLTRTVPEHMLSLESCLSLATAAVLVQQQQQRRQNNESERQATSSSERRRASHSR